MPNPPPITDAEELVMRELWLASPLSAQDVADRLAARTSWKLTTVKTLLNRLAAKGAVKAVQRGKANDYTPAFTQDAWVAAQSSSFLDRVFNGALTPMVAHFFEKRRVSDAELSALRELLTQAERSDQDAKGNPAPASRSSLKPRKERPS
jgi:predicted transcriptional regulator